MFSTIEQLPKVKNRHKPQTPLDGDAESNDLSDVLRSWPREKSEPAGAGGRPSINSDGFMLIENTRMWQNISTLSRDIASKTRAFSKSAFETEAAGNSQKFLSPSGLHRHGFRNSVTELLQPN